MTTILLGSFGIVDVLEVEEWREIPNLLGYDASNLGRVRSVDRVVYRNTSSGAVVSVRRRGCVLRQATDQYGYKFVRRWRVHRLVAAAWHGPCPDGLVVNHINGIKADNRPQNLEYVTNAENIRHAHRTGLSSLCGIVGPTVGRFGRGGLNINAVLNEEMVLKILSYPPHIGPTQIASELGCKMYLVSRVRTGRSWCHLREGAEKQ